MSHVNAQEASLFSRINWTNTVFLIFSPLILFIFGPIHLSLEGFDWRLFAIFLFFAIATGLSITAGYHRLFAHRSYETKLPLKLFYLIFGAAALQGSAIKWASDHRRHHKFVDGDEDPYNINKGFFYAHMGWVFFKDDPKYRDSRSPDLCNDKWLVWQDKYSVLLLIVVGFLAPTLIGLSFGSPWGGFLFGGVARIVLVHHCTFLINSLCHIWGTQPYGDKTSAKDSFLMALFTYGEGYHNFHHRFEADYRNGIKWYHWDPTKWWIRTLSFFGVTRNLRRVPDQEILKARLQADEKVLTQYGFYDERLREIRTKIEETQKKIALFKMRYRELKKDFSAQRDDKIRQLRADLRNAQLEFKAAWAQYKSMYRQQLAMVA